MRGRVRISCFAKQRNCEKSRRSSKLLYNLLVLPTLIGGLAAIGIATAAGYQSMAPTGQWYGRTFTGLARGTKQLALTYDDGPNDPHTLKLLEVLAKHEVHATFFMIGRYVRQRPDVAREVAHAGHVIGNHTFTHSLLTFESDVQTRIQLQECRDALTDVVGEHRSKPEYSTFMSSRVAMETPELPILP